jgi:Pyruvate/2-oxoacid:ferredoxin oxidoreductase gamma subunit
MFTGLNQIGQFAEATEKAAELPGLEGVLSLLVVAMVGALIYAVKRSQEASATAQAELSKVVQANTAAFATHAAKAEQMAHEQEEARKALDDMRQAITNLALMCARKGEK